MDAKTKCIVSAALVSCGAACVIGGSYWRDRVDRGLGLNVASAMSLNNLLASKQSDFDVSEGDYFRDLAVLLEDKYYERISDEKKLANGAVRGMVLSLNDPNSTYMDKDEYAAFGQARAGKYEGIGADFRFVMPNHAETDASLLPESATNDRTLRIPHLAVSLVVPGGPADRAGVKVGDWVDTIDGKWVVSPEPIEEFRAAQAKLGSGTPSPELLAMARKLKAMTDHAIMPAKAGDLLFLGSSGTIDVSWHRGPALRQTKISKMTSDVRAQGLADGAFALQFVSGAPEALKAAILGGQTRKIDLRNNVRGDFESMRACLAAVAPAGSYGYIADDRNKAHPRILSVRDGNSHPVKLTLLVDRSTGGAAEIFAESLAAKGLAKIEGGPMAGDRTIVEVFELPEGCGYTLQTGVFTISPRPPTRAMRSPIRTRIVAETGPTEDLES